MQCLLGNFFNVKKNTKTGLLTKYSYKYSLSVARTYCRYQKEGMKYFSLWSKCYNRGSLIIFWVCFTFGMAGSHGTVGITACCRSGSADQGAETKFGVQDVCWNEGRGGRMEQREKTNSRCRTKGASANQWGALQRSRARQYPGMGPNVACYALAWLRARHSLLQPGQDLNSGAVCIWNQLGRCYRNPSFVGKSGSRYLFSTCPCLRGGDKEPQFIPTFNRQSSCWCSNAT